MMVPTAQIADGLTASNSNVAPMTWVVRTHGDPHRYIADSYQQFRQGERGISGGGGSAP